MAQGAKACETLARVRRLPKRTPGDEGWRWARRTKGEARMGQDGRQGLYDPRNEHDACGVGFVANIKGRKSHDIVRRGLQILLNLNHRGAVGADPLVGDGVGCLLQIPDALFRDWAEKKGLTLPPPGDY